MAHYKLLALDIDGTLVGPDQAVAEETVDALAAAERAGLRVCLATGRSYAESIGIWRQLRLLAPPQPMILVGGALVSEPDTARTLCQRPIPFQTACEFADALGQLGHAAMVLVDAWRHGVDYLVTAGGDQHAASRDWFSKMGVRVRRVDRLADASDAPEPLRISAVAEPQAARAVAGDLMQRFDGRLNVHAILAPNYGVTVVEAHAAGADKLSAIKYVAQGLRIGTGRIAAVGDDVNDLPMVQGVGLGAAMPHAPPELLAAARHVARGGLAAFVRELLAGRLDPKD
jgi:hypothetical protein